jgi:uroporphyrinogen-III synthase
MGETTEALTLLLTRPEAQSRAFAARLAALAGRPLPHVIAPLFEVVPTGAGIPGQGVLALTSGRAVENLPAGVLKGRRVYCIGAVTAGLVRAAGAEALLAGDDGEALVARLMADRPGSVVLLRGDHVAGDPATRLIAAGIPVTEIRVYATRDLPLNDAALVLLAEGGAILAPVFSPRSADLLARAAAEALPRLTVAAISRAAAAPLAGAARVVVSTRPDAEAMARLVLTLWPGLP